MVAGTFQVPSVLVVLDESDMKADDAKSETVQRGGARVGCSRARRQRLDREQSRKSDFDFGNIAPQTMASSGSIGTVSFRGSDVLIIVHYEIQAL